MELSIQQLRMLREVALQGTIAAAADSLGYSASAVSQQLSSAEKATGVAVLERVGRNVLLTDAGRELVVHANVVLAQMEAAQAAVERVQGDVAGTLRVGFFESLAGTMLGPLILRLREQHPTLGLRTSGIDLGDPFSMLRRGEQDVAFVVDYPSFPGPQHQDLDRVRVCYDWFRIVMPTEWFEGKRVPKTMALVDLAGEPFIAPPASDSCGRSVWQSCRRAGFEPDVAHDVTEYPATLRLVAAGIGVSLVPDLGLQFVPEGVSVIDMRKPVARTIELCFRKSSADRPAVRAFIKATQAVANEMALDVSGD